MNANKYFLALYAATHQAADILDVVANDETVKLAAADELVRLTNAAACAARSLRARVAGEPEPRRGE